MRICNYTVGQADADNTWASIQDNGSHIISFNINLYNPINVLLRWQKSAMVCVRI